MKPVEWLGDRLKILDQTELPLAEKYLQLTDYRDVISAIKELRVRGAPAIGISAAYGICIGAMSIHETGIRKFRDSLERVCADFAAARPTAVNLFHAIEHHAGGGQTADYRQRDKSSAAQNGRSL